MGAYPSITGNRSPQIEVGPGMNQTCSVSTEPLTEGVNVYECVLDSPVSVDGVDTLTVSQRNVASQIGFLHDGQTDTPLISVNSSK